MASPQIFLRRMPPVRVTGFSLWLAAVNCTLWVVYGLWRPKKDIPGAVANAPGVLFGGVAAITALI